VHARYHFQEVLRLTTEFTDAHLADATLFDVAVVSEVELREAFELLMVKIGAHTIACIQALHSLSDTLAHAMYYTLGLNLHAEALRERDISTFNVKRLLDAHDEHQTLATALAELSEDPTFRHVAALANRAKHRSLVKPLLNEDLTGERSSRHEIRIASFDYNGTTFPESPLQVTLEPAYELASRLVVGVGRRMNAYLATLPATL
jgi:hypothetical protein